jgi:Ca-activated chloride channel family protein
MQPNTSLVRMVSVLLLSVFTLTPRAQSPFIKIDGKESNLVYLQQLNVDVRIHGNVATTIWTMTFKNSTGRTLEGELNFPLAEGVTVSRYALDINGRLRAAVPVEKEKGTLVFENIQRRRVDPGLLEKVEGNGFRTRIYPINPNGVRTVLIGYEEELSMGASSSLRWRLPLAFSKPLENFNLSVQVFRGAVKPLIEENIGDAFQFEAWQDNWSATHRWEHFKADRSLTILLPKSPEEHDVIMQPSGNHYLYLLSAFPKAKKIAKPQPHHITLLWDASLSGLTRDHEKELKLLDAYLLQLKEVEVTLVSFNYAARPAQHFDVHNGQWKTLHDSLEQMVYDGATQFGALHPDDYPCDEYLLFSDGRSNYGSDRMPAAHKPLYAVVASASTDYPFLRDLTERSAGELVSLETGTIDEAKTQLLYQSLYFMGIKADPQLEENYPSQPVTVVHSISVAGICYQPTHEVVLQFGYGGKVLSETKVALDFTRQKAAGIDLSKVWAQKKIAQLDMHYEDNNIQIRQLGRRYGLITRNTSLIVLESVEDYVTYNIEPPAELRGEYDRIIKMRGQTDRQRRKETTEGAQEYFDQLLSWWKTDFANLPKHTPAPEVEQTPPSHPTPPSPIPDNSPDFQRNFLGAATDSIHGVNRRQAPAADQSASFSYSSGAARAEDIVSDKKDGRSASPSPTPSSGEFKAFHHEVQTAYLTRLKRTPAAGQYAVYLQQRRTQLYTPVFYFNTARFFISAGKKELGLQILSNIAELDIESYEVYKMLGYELRRLGERTAACAAFKKILDWRPFEPQSYRDYGLALQDAGLYQQAFDTLYTALVKNYDDNIEARFPGIEEVLLPEINSLVALKGDKINFSRLPKTLLKNMPVDIRVVLNWNMNDTDIDLWVTDPNGEKCFYSHKETELGGRISNDFTGGLGPEQFLLKKAAKGHYKVQVDYYGDTQVKLAGPTTILVEIYTHYGTDRQTRKLLPLQLQTSGEKTVLVGEFNFE